MNVITFIMHTYVSQYSYCTSCTQYSALSFIMDTYSFMLKSAWKFYSIRTWNRPTVCTVKLEYTGFPYLSTVICRRRAIKVNSPQLSASRSTSAPHFNVLLPLPMLTLFSFAFYFYHLRGKHSTAYLILIYLGKLKTL